MSDKDVTSNDVMNFLQEHMVTREELGVELKNMKSELRSEMQKNKLDMMDSMDDKLSSLKGDLVIMLRKEDKKVSALIDLLKSKEVITVIEADELLELRPFPQM
jgi:hypothetical protein